MQNESPKLAAPGAGLPFLEHLIVRYFIFPNAYKKTTPQSNLDHFQKIGSQILQTVSTLDPSALSKRVLIKRLPGLEDSSRNWSVEETLEHLWVVGNGMSQIAETLAKGEKIPFEVKTANVKPKGKRKGAEIILDFKNLLSERLEADKKFITLSISDSKNGGKHLHPWFGELHAHEWIFLRGFHQGLHFKQIQKIIAGI